MVVKKVASIICNPVADIINECFSTGLIPSKLKISKIIPVHKKGSKDDVSNYRPVALLSVFSKIIERIIYNRLLSFFIDNNIFVMNQYGVKIDYSLKWSEQITTVISKMSTASYLIGSLRDQFYGSEDIKYIILIENETADNLAKKKNIEAMSRSRKMVLMAQQLEEENELINKNNINEQVSNGKATAADHSGSFDGAINQILINNDSENYSEGVKSTILPIHDSEEPPTTYLHNNESLTIESAILPISSSNLHECPPTDEELLKWLMKT
nr:unnamed protein product [Callosobruchus analis]